MGVQVGRGESGEVRFSFGKNWSSFLEWVTEERIQTAVESLSAMLGESTLSQRRFLDAGSGSGLFSLAARRMGAAVHSFDYDQDSVAATAELKRRFYPGDCAWHVEQASVLDDVYMDSLGDFDVVYSWGVLHHTGQMWKAIDNVTRRVCPGGRLFISIYNHMGGASRRWTWIKRTYCGLPTFLRLPFAIMVTTPIQAYSIFVHLVQGKLSAYVDNIRNYRKHRGMSWWHDQLDWIGGYPYEDAKPEEIFDFVKQRGFSLERLKTWGGASGCNEFLFVKTTS